MTLSTGAFVVVSALLKTSDHATHVLTMIAMGNMVLVSTVFDLMMFFIMLITLVQLMILVLFGIGPKRIIRNPKASSALSSVGALAMVALRRAA